MPYWRAFYHLVWSTKKREPLIGPEEEQLIRRSFQLTFDDLRAIPHAVGVMPDHVHVALSFPPKHSGADIVQHLKGASAHAVNHRRSESSLAHFAWQEGYGLLMFGEKALKDVVTYVENQLSRHANNDLWLPMERDVADPPPPSAGL
jgi:putative transposase